MAYDKGLATRLTEHFQSREDILPGHHLEKKMFGGLCYMVNDHMTCGIVGDTLMARVGPDQYEQCLAQEHVAEMDFTGKAMKGMVYVAPEGIQSDEQLASWVDCCLVFVHSLPPKKPKISKQ